MATGMIMKQNGYQNIQLRTDSIISKLTLFFIIPTVSSIKVDEKFQFCEYF